jgi:PfaB family protein
VQPTIAIVGIGASFDAVDGVVGLDRAIFQGRQLDPPATRPAEEALAALALADAGLPAAETVSVDGGVVSGLAEAERRLADGAGAVVLVAADATGGVALAFARAGATGGCPYARLREVDAAAIGYLDAPSEPAALAAARVLPPGPAARVAVGGLDGRVGAIGELLALARAALALRGRFSPPTPRWPGPPDPARWRDAGLYVPTEQRPWFAPPGGRRGAVVALEGGQLRLDEAPRPAASRPTFAQIGDVHLLLVSGADTAALLAGAERAAAALEAGADPAALCLAVSRARSSLGEPRLVLLGRDRADLLREIGAARSGLTQALAASGEWQTPRGSYCAARPLGGAGLAFVYPGAFSSYLGMARESLRLFPRGHDWLTELSSDVGARMAERRLYPRAVERPTVEELSRWEAELADDALGLIESGISLSSLHTRALREVFGVRPASAFGYSLGEITMLIALGVWRPDEPSTARLESSPLFRTRLAGPKEAVRAHRSLPPGVAAEWSTYVLLAPPAIVEAALDPSDPAHLTIVNGPEEVVIAGDPAACARLIARVGREALPAPFGHVLHCPPAEGEQAEFAAVMRFPTRAVDGITFYSAADYGPLDLAGSLADDLARMSVRRLDFARLVERVYADGARVYVELGAGGTTTRLIRTILKERPHVVVQLVRRGADDQTSLYRALARLVSHGVPLELGPLFAGRSAA